MVMFLRFVWENESHINLAKYIKQLFNKCPELTECPGLF
jgi:hypothetical protein